MAVFLHAGQGKSLRSKNIIGIFDMDESTVSGITRDYLSKMQKKKMVVNITTDIPKSFILYGKKNEREPVAYISQLSAGTLGDRLKRKI